MRSRSELGGRILVSIALVAMIGLGAPAAAQARGAAPDGTTGSSLDASTTFRMDLSNRSDFVAQTNFVQCVGASMQMMLNMMATSDDRTSATQRRLQVLARTLSGERPDGRERQGASVRGWTAGLNQLDAGPYRTVGSTDIGTALKVAARAIRETGRPVGLLVWRGRHAWVMAGFTATADPRITDEFEVIEAVVMDPLYPHGSAVWGPSPKPRQSLTVAELGRQFVRRATRASFNSAAWSQALSGTYVTVLPYAPARVGRALRAGG